MLMAVRVGCGSAVPQTRTRSGDPRFDPALRGHQRSAGAGQTAPSPLKGGVTGQLSQCHDLSPRRRMPRRRQDRGHASHLRRMQSPTDPADRTGTIGVEAFDAAYGAGFQASDDSPHAVECDLARPRGWRRSPSASSRRSAVASATRAPKSTEWPIIRPKRAPVSWERPLTDAEPPDPWGAPGPPRFARSGLCLERVPHVEATRKPERCVRPVPAADAGRRTVHRGG